MNLLLSHNSETLGILTQFCNQNPSNYRNLVKICNELVKKVKNIICHHMIWFLRQDPGWSDLILARGQPILEKSQRTKRKFWDQKVLFGTKFLKSGPKRANPATLTTTSRHRCAQIEVSRRNFFEHEFQFWDVPQSGTTIPSIPHQDQMCRSHFITIR